MARPRKALDAQTGHLTKQTQETRRYEESLVTTGKDELAKIPSALLLDNVAKKEYKRTLENLKKIELIGNLDRSALISYANSYSLYMRACEELRLQGFELSEKGKVNPVITVMNQAKREMESAAKALGMSASARLQAASNRAKDEAESIKEVFGDI